MEEITLEERFNKIRSPNLESQKQTAIVLNAVEATLKEQNAEATPTAYFAALLALLSQSVGEDASKKNLDTSIIYLLDLVTPYTPHALLRAKFAQIMSSLAPVFTHPNSDAPLIRPSIGCLESLLLAQDSAAWELSAAQISPRRAVAGLLTLSVDPRPKVRKRALEALRNVLDTPPPGPTLDHPASAMCAETAMASLKELASRARQANKKEKHSGSAPGTHDPDLIHALHLVRSIAESSSGWPSKKIEPLCELLLSIARTGNDHMSVAVLEVFEMIFQGMTSDISTSKLQRLLEIISELRPAPNDTQLLPPWIAILSRGYDVSAQVEPEDTFYKLPDLFKMVMPYLESPSGNIRESASECLISFLANCIPKQVVSEPSIYDEKILSKLAGLASDLLSVRYQAAAEGVFGVLGAMFEALRWRSAPYLLDVTKTLGDLRGSEAFAGKKEVDKLLGAAIRAMGPATVLEVLPHNLTRASPQHPGRAWLLPLFRDFTTNTNLEDFKTIFLPLSNVLYQKVLDNGNAEKTTEIKIFETIVQQIWSILPGFCDVPLDVKTAFDNGFAELLANLLYQQVDLRVDVCRGLTTLIETNQVIVSLSDGEDDMFLQSRVSREEARTNLEHLGTFAGQYLAVLFNVYGQTMAQSRGLVLQTINAFLSITPMADLVKSFDEVCRLLAISLKEAAASTGKDQQKTSGTAVPPMSATLMDLMITMAPHLPRESYSALFEIASLALVKEDDPQLQKKAYKLIPRLVESNAGWEALSERHEELQALMLASAERVTAPARRERLATLDALLKVIPSTGLHFIPTMLSEAVISCKEHNERARTAAFDLLVYMGQRMVDFQGSRIDNSKVPNMAADAPAVEASIEEFFTMVSAGLAGSTPHMVSATITALSRLLYDFHEMLDRQALEDLVQTVDLFLTSNNREIVRSVLGFVKVCTISLPTDMVRTRLPTLIPNLMVWSHEHKGHFRAKVKHILDRMVRRFGFEVVNKNCPEQDRKLMTNIRKTKERNKRKKKEAAEAAAAAGDNSDEDTREVRRRRRGTTSFDEALCSSDDSDEEDEEDSDEEDDEKQAQSGGRKRGSKGGNAYIIEEEGEPLDLLDRKAMASISSTKPIKQRKAGKRKAQYNADGKLVLGGANDGAGSGSMDVDEPEDGGAGNGVNAYMAAVSGKDVPKRGFRGKLKWSNKRGQGGDEDDEEAMTDGDAVIIKSKLDKSPGGRREKQPFRGGGRGRGGGQRGGGGRGQSGSGRASFGRRGLGEEKRRAGGNGVGKSWPNRR